MATGAKVSAERRIPNPTLHLEDIPTTYPPCWWRGWCRGTAPCWGGWGATRATPCARGGSAAGWWAWTGWGAGWEWRSRPGPPGTERAGGCREGAPQSHLKGICKTRARQWSKSWSDDKTIFWAVGRTVEFRRGRGGRRWWTWREQTRLAWMRADWRQQRLWNNCSCSCQESLRQLRASSEQMLQCCYDSTLSHQW